MLVVLVGANAAILSDASKLRLHHRDSTACQRQLRANANTNAEEQPRARYRVCGNTNYSSICKDTLRCMHSLRTSNREKNLTFSGGATLRENEHNESHCVVSCCQCFKKPCESYCAWHKIDEHLQQIKRHVQEQEGEEEEHKIYSSKLLTDITLATQTSAHASVTAATEREGGKEGRKQQGRDAQTPSLSPELLSFPSPPAPPSNTNSLPHFPSLPPLKSGKFSSTEDARYEKLLKEFGQPVKENQNGYIIKRFEREFPARRYIYANFVIISPKKDKIYLFFDVCRKNTRVTDSQQLDSV